MKLKNLNNKNFKIAKASLYIGREIKIVGKYLITINKNFKLIERIKDAKAKKQTTKKNE